MIDATANYQVILEFAWDVPTDHVVLVDLWMSSGSRESMRFISEFSPKRKALNDAMKFVPHYHVFSMESTVDNGELCLDDRGEFCAEDPDGDGPITGKMVIEEDVRQLCIHDITKVKRSSPEIRKKGVQHVEYSAKYWDYVELMRTECSIDDAKNGFGEECSEKLMRKVGINVGKVKNCVDTSKIAKLTRERKNTAWSPRALRINSWRYTGMLDADVVTRAICAGFVNQPDACNELIEPINVFRDTKPPEDGVDLSTLMIALLVVGALTLGALLMYKRSLTKHIHTALREEVMLEVQTQMASYKQLPA